jgi:hypothetical protein
MLEGMTPPAKKPNCRVKAVAQGLDPKDAKILHEAVISSEWTILGLSNELKKRGITIGEKPITAHRKGLCGCSKT